MTVPPDHRQFVCISFDNVDLQPHNAPSHPAAAKRRLRYHGPINLDPLGGSGND